jgi:hypothetical protein
MDLIQALNIFYDNFIRIVYMSPNDTSKELWEEIKRIRNNSQKEKEAFEFLETNCYYGGWNSLKYGYGDLMQVNSTGELVKITKNVIDVDSLECGYIVDTGEFYEESQLTLIEECVPIACA